MAKALDEQDVVVNVVEGKSRGGCSSKGVELLMLCSTKYKGLSLAHFSLATMIRVVRDLTDEGAVLLEREGILIKTTVRKGEMEDPGAYLIAAKKIATS